MDGPSGEGGGDDGEDVCTFGDEDLLVHPLRRRIVDLLDQRPGMNKNQVREELDVNRTVLEHHLDRLENEGIVITRSAARDREMLVFLSGDEELWRDERTRILFGREGSRNVGLYIAENPGVTTKQIAKALGLTRVTIRHHIRRLSEYGLLSRESEGRSVLYNPRERLRDWSEDLGAQFNAPWRK